MSVINSNYIGVESYTIKIIGDKYNSRTDTTKKNCLLSETKSTKYSNFHEIGLLIEHLEQIHCKHVPTEIILSVEVREKEHEE